MATVEQVWQGLEQQIATAFAGTNPLLNLPATQPAPEIGIDWPFQKCIGAVSSGQERALISIFDRGATKNITQAIPLLYALPPTNGTPGGVITPSASVLPAQGTVTLTGSGTPFVNDAFCFTLLWGYGNQFQAFANYTVPNTTTSLATALAGMVAQINTIEGLTATLLDDVITITNNTNTNYNVRSEVVNVGTLTVEGYRWLRDIQVTLWTGTPLARMTYGTVLEQLFTLLEVNYGFIAADQSACRVCVAHDFVHYDTQLQDVYRRDWILQIDYPVLYTLPTFAIETIPQTVTSPVPND